LTDAGWAGTDAETSGAEAVKAFLRDNPEVLRDDESLLSELGLRLGANVVDFGPVALARVAALHQRESSERQRLEAVARANYSAQEQTHAAVVDLLESRNHSDLARRVDELARLRFGLAAGAVALEGPGNVPAGWKALVEGQVDLLLGPRKLARLGIIPTALGLFGMPAGEVGSVALVRLAIWDPARQGVIGFASADPEAFTSDMGEDLVAFLARVVERTAERWPAP